MADTFEDLGLRPALLDAVEEEDLPGPTRLQAEAIPVLRRGGNAVLLASSGAGVRLAYGLPLLDRLVEARQEEPADGELEDEEAKPGAGAPAPRGLVLTATEEEASEAATSLARFARPEGVQVSALAPGWSAPGPTVDALVATPGATLAALRRSTLKLDRLLVFVQENADLLLHAAADAVEAITAALPSGAQRIVVAGSEGGEVERYVTGHVRRALQFPRMPAEGSAGQAEESAAGAVFYAVRPDSEKGELVARVLDAGITPRPIVYCRTDERAAQLAEFLAARGYDVGAVEDEAAGVTIASASAPPAPGGLLAISVDVPADSDTLGERHGEGGLVVVEPGELPHLRRIARWAGVALAPRPEALPAGRVIEIESERDRVRTALAEADLAPALLLLEPLFREASPTEVAAALLTLLRSRPIAVSGRRTDAAGAPAPPATAGAVRPSVAPPAPQGWVRLFFGVGRRDHVGPGDLVGAITGESAVTGHQIGKIDVGETFTIVEVSSDVAERVIRGLNGTTIRGRSVRVDYDRPRGGGARGGDRRTRRSSPPRGRPGRGGAPRDG